MILTGKALEDFLIKVYYQEDTNQVGTCINHTEDELIQIESTRWISQQDDRFINALIIEFFDSVGIYIILRRLTMCLEFKEWFFFIENNRGVHLNNYLEDECRVKTDSRQEATEKAIIKANEIYNERTNLSNKI